MPLVEEILSHQAAFLFILIRVAAFFLAMPLIGGGGVPNIVKAMIVLSTSFMLFQVVKLSVPPLGLLTLVLGILSEIVIGLILGLVVRLLFGAVEIGAEIVGTQMGFGAAQMFDPISNQQASLMGRLEGVLVMLIFLGIRGHHIVIEALVRSFDLVPGIGFYPSGVLVEQIVEAAGRMFILGLKIGLPVIVALLMANAAIGVLSRVVPQMNVLLFSFPVTISLGLVVLGLSLPVLGQLIAGEISHFKSVFPGLLAAMRRQ